MTPIRRRTFFGRLSDRKLGVLVREAGGTDNLLANLRDREKSLGREVAVSPELIAQNAKDREMRMAASAELKRREERQAAGMQRRR